MTNPPPKTVEVKWNKQIFSNVDLPSTSDELKSALRGMTGVKEDRQTLMCKSVWKGILASGVAFADLSWPSGNEKVTIVLMGTPTEKATTEPPKEKIVFLEDMSLGQAALTGKVLPPGLSNLGNTCYLNSVIQVVHGAPELVQAIANTNSFQGIAPQDALLAVELKKLFSEMSRTNSEVVPARFVNTVRSVLPQFNQKSTRGEFQQQDADEFYNELMLSLSRSLKNNSKSVIDDFFGIELSIKTKCLETDQEPETTSHDTMRRIQCIINENISHLSAGLKLGLEGDVEKMSEVLNRNANFKQIKRLSRCPKFLVVQLNRFFWKLTPDSQDHRGVNCKILRAVKFPKVLDVFELCDENLQKVLKVQRNLRMEAILDGSKKPRETTDKEGGTSTDEVMKGQDEGEMDEELKKALAMSMVDDDVLNLKAKVLGTGVPGNFSGKYECVGVVSHKGRSANSGHYMGWIRNSANSNKWVCFDDDHPSECEWKDVDALAADQPYRRRRPPHGLYTSLPSK